MFGGYRYDGGDYYLNDIYNVTVYGTIATWVQLSSEGNVPSAREGHTITLRADGGAVMFGGAVRTDSTTSTHSRYLVSPQRGCSCRVWVTFTLGATVTQ